MRCKYLIRATLAPGDVVIAKAKEDAASGLAKKLNELGQAIDKATQCTFGRACSSDEPDEESKPNVAGNLTDEEKAALGGAGSGTPGGHGPEDEENARAREQQQNRFNELSDIFDKSNPSKDLTIDGQTIRQGESINNYGTTKVYEIQGLIDDQIRNYAQQLAGETPLNEVRPGIYNAKLSDGTSITLREVSSSKTQTEARWTIDIKGNQQLSDNAYKYKDVEIKFK